MGIFSKLRTVFVISSSLGYLFVTQVGSFARVEGNSMQPALNPDLEQDDWVFLNRLVANEKYIKRGDIVTFKSPKYPHRKFIKRVIGLSGDVINTLGYQNEIIQIPDKQCWVEGDYAAVSLDSNTFGPIPLDIITAKATHIVWPPHRWQSLNNYVPDRRTPITNFTVSAA